MLIYGRVIDTAAKAAIQAATVTVLSATGAPVGITASTDSAGNFRIDSPAISLGQRVLFSHPDYNNNELDVPGTGSFGFVSLVKKPVTSPPLQEVETPTAPTGSMPVWLWLAIVGGLLFAFSKDRRRAQQSKTKSLY